MSESHGEALDDEASCLRALVDALDDSAVFVLDARGCVSRWNGATRTVAHQEGTPIGRHVSTFYAEPERTAGKPEEDLRLAQADGRFEEESWRLRCDGTRFWARVTVSPLRDEKGQLVGFTQVMRDCTRVHDAETELAATRALLRATIDSIDDGVLAADVEGRVLVCNDAAIWNPALAGAEDGPDSGGLFLADQSTPCLAEATPLTRARHGESVRQVELFAQTRADIEGRWYSVNAAPVWDGRGIILGSVAVARDMTATKTRETELKQLSLVDELTGLCNRRAFLSLASHQLAVARRTGRPVALFFVDLDGLKEINDAFGHDRGDAALREAGAILSESFRCSDVIARLGGDEFAILALDTDVQRVEVARDRLATNVDEFNRREARDYSLSMSIGSCVHSPVDSESLETMLARADGAMYEEKRRRHASRPPRTESPSDYQLKAAAPRKGA